MIHPSTSARAAFLAERPRNRMVAIAARFTDVIGLGRGDPDLPTPPHIIEAACQAARDGQTHYTPTLGIPPLREALSAKLRDENGVQFGPDEILIAAGGQEAVNLIMQGLLNPGDEMIIPNPSYGSYALAAHLAGGVPVQVPLDRSAGFQFDLAEIERRITPRTKAIAVVSPNNPTGTVQEKAALEGVADIARRRNLLVISDEIYEKILFDGAVHYSIAALPEMRDRTVIVNGFSKLYSMTGWRVGWIAATRALMVGMQAVKDTYMICTPAPNQWAALAALTGPQDCVRETLAIYTRRRRWLIEGLQSSGLSWAPHGGSLFIFVDISATGLSSDAFCVGLLEQERVLTYPGSDFGPIGEGYIRMTLLAPDARFREAVDRFARFARRARKS
jgi:aspartate/methionine/tyrosine aminotransferase